MPCDQINTMSVTIEAADRALLARALTGLGLRHSVAADGRVTVRAPGGTIVITNDTATLPAALQPTLNAIKDAYTRAVVAEAAEQYGWNLVEDEEEPGQYLLRRYD